MGGLATDGFADRDGLLSVPLTSEVLSVGQEITAIGAPRHDDPNAWFLKAIILPDGTRFDALQSPNQQR